MKDKYGLTAKQEITIEFLNAFTHGLASIISIIGLILLLLKIEVSLFNRYWFAYIIYGLSLFILFTNSTLYHSFSFSKFKHLFQKFDHASIYLLIAGSYTPYILLKLHQTPLIFLLIFIWLFAIAGIIFEVKYTDRFPKLSTYFYLGLGWMSIFMIYPLITHMNLNGIILLLLGGLLYTVGTIFYRKKHNKWMHVIWHIFVIIAALSMYLSIYWFT